MCIGLQHVYAVLCHHSLAKLQIEGSVRKACTEILHEQCALYLELSHKHCTYKHNFYSRKMKGSSKILRLLTFLVSTILKQNVRYQV